jgi:hypothetical protein
LFGPDGLAVRGLAGPPALGEVGDKEQAASTFVEGPGPAEVRGGAAAVGDLADERPVPDETELNRALGVPDSVSYEFADATPRARIGTDRTEWIPNLRIVAARAGLWPVDQRNVGSSAPVSTALLAARQRADGKDSG